MAAVPRSLLRATVLAVLTITSYLLSCGLHRRSQDPGSGGTSRPFQPFPFSNSGKSRSAKTRLTPSPERDIFGRLDLTETECRDAFPGLFWDVDDMVKRGAFVFEKSNPDYTGLVQGRIKDGQLFILTTAPDRIPQILHQRLAILSQIHRALITSPSPLPDTYFAFVTNDVPKNNSWAFAKVNKQPNPSSSARILPENPNVWTMPHFAFWGWTGAADSRIGAMDEALTRISAVEESTPWEKKIAKLVWRGTPWFNPLAHPTLRQDLLRITKGKEWADVQALNTSSDGKLGGGYSNALCIEDFCRYRYVLYTEGVTYSGRLPYHQACESVLLMAPLTYLTYTTSSIKPIKAEDLMAMFEKKKEEEEKAASNKPPIKNGKQLLIPILPTVAPKQWHEANAIYISPTFSNLETILAFLEGHPEIAKQIARNQRDAVVRRGFLSGAAETCYWRELIKGWAGVAREEESWKDERGMRFEEWVLGQVVTRSERNRRGAKGKHGKI